MDTITEFGRKQKMENVGEDRDEVDFGSFRDLRLSAEMKLKVIEWKVPLVESPQMLQKII